MEQLIPASSQSRNATFSSASISGDQLTLNLTDVVDQSVVSVTLNGINDTNGSPVSGDNDIEIRALVGDANQDWSVGSPDAQGVKMHLGEALDQTSENFLFDLDLGGDRAQGHSGDPSEQSAHRALTATKEREAVLPRRSRRLTALSHGFRRQKTVTFRPCHSV